jgi:hypothetical protein
VNTFFFDLPNPSGRYALEFTQSLTEINTRSTKIMFLVSKMRPVRWAELTTVCETIV